MAENQRLKAKLAALQLRLMTDEFMKRTGAEILDILKLFQEKSIRYKVISIDNLAEGMIPSIGERFSQEPFPSLGLANTLLTTNCYQEEIYKCFPDEGASFTYYFPKLDQVKAWEPEKNDYLKEFLDQEKLPEQKVFIYYLRIGLLLEAKLYDLLNIDEDELFDGLYDNIVIHPDGFEWMILFSGNDAKRFGFVRKKNNN